MGDLTYFESSVVGFYIPLTLYVITPVHTRPRLLTFYRIGETFWQTFKEDSKYVNEIYEWIALTFGIQVCFWTCVSK